MKKRITSIALFTCAILYQPAFVQAQAPATASTSQTPVLPMNVQFRYLPQYLIESIENDLQYARIEALVDEGRCDVVLLDRTTGRRAFYSTSSRRVDALKANGEDAYVTLIDFESFVIGVSNQFRIRLHDHAGQLIEWQFVTGEMVPHVSPEVISRTDNSGIAFFYAPRRAAAAVGTSLTIGDRNYVPEPPQSDHTFGTFYATEITIGQILPGTELWRVASSPVTLGQTAQWDLRGQGGRQRILAVKRLDETGASMDQTELDDPDAPEVEVELAGTGDTYSLRSLSATAHGNTLWIFFGPALPLPGHQADEETTVAFTIAENEDANIASGRLAVRRTFDTEHLEWHFDNPDVATGEEFETGVNLIPYDSEQAKCINEDCL